jgi:hypothetical protein
MRIPQAIEASRAVATAAVRGVGVFCIVDLVTPY